jgi:uncharacterized protein (TIGR00730 family)
MRVGITLTSSLEVGEEYIRLTKQVAQAFAGAGAGIVYGGTNYGMMATLADSYKKAGGTDLTGVMAKDLMRVTKNYIAYEELDTALMEETMEDRKRKIVELSDAFIILPGGYGTLEEIGSIVGGKANKLFDKPIAFYNYGGFYDSFIKFLAEMHGKQFSKLSHSELFLTSDDLQEILAYFRDYRPAELADKFVS